MPREILYQRIDRRVDQMMENGLKAEAFSLFEQGLTPERFTAMRSIGYAQLYDCFMGSCTEQEAVERIKLDTRHFAKRQITWFKRDTNTVWMDPTQTGLDEMIRQIEDML